MTALPFIGGGSLRHLQSFLQLQELKIRPEMSQLLELGGPLQLPALQRLNLDVTHENPLETLRIFAPSQLLDLELALLGSWSLAAYYELETFIIGQMPNLRSIELSVETKDYIDLVFVQPVESTTQSSSARQSESLRRIDCAVLVWPEAQGGIFFFKRLIESAPHLEECHLVAPMKSLPYFGPHIRKLELSFLDSHVLHVLYTKQFELVHLEVLKLSFETDEQLELLELFEAPSLLFLEVKFGLDYESEMGLIPLEPILEILSKSQGIHDLELKLPFPADDMELSLPELRNLKVTDMSHNFSLASFDVPKLQLLFLEIGGEDESIAGGEDLAEDTIGIASPPPSFEDLPDDPSDLVVARAPTFPALPFEHVTDFEFTVSSDYGPDPRALPSFASIFTAFPALERVALPSVLVNESPYIDQLVKKISENPTLCPNLQEIRTRDYPNEWSNLLKFLRERKRASMLSNPTLRPIHALHFPITPHGSIVEQLQDAMLGKASVKTFPALRPWPLLVDSTLVHIASSRGEDAQVDYDAETRSRVQAGDEQMAATHVQAQEEGVTRNGAQERQSERGSSCGKREDEALSCFFCHKAGLGSGCGRTFQKRQIVSWKGVSIRDVLCSRWDYTPDFEVICSP